MKHALILPPPEELRNPKISLQMRGMPPAEIRAFVVAEAISGRYEYADLFMQYAPLIAAPQRIDRHVPIEASEGLPKWVDTYLQNGAPNGERNHRLYAVARAYNDAGLTMGQCTNEAVGRARADGLTDEEITRTIESAFSAPRSIQIDPKLKARMAGNDALIRNRREIEF